jgi:UDP:flavonoid glycosyltransferase YjiC (YdhE family)
MTTCPLTGHYWPMVPLGWALRSAGHDVRVASLPNLSIEVTGSGLPALTVGERADLPAMLREANEEEPGDGRPAAVNLRGLIRWNARLSALLIDALLGIVRAQPPDIIVHEPMDMCGPLLSGLLGVPAVLHPMGLPLRDAVTAGLRRAGGALRVRYGLPDRPGTPAMVLDTCPPGFGETPADNELRQAMRFLPFGGPGEIADWARQPAVGRRVLVASSVDSGETDSAMRLLEIANALAGPDVEVIAPLPDPIRARVDPQSVPGVRIVPWSPLHMSTDGCAAVVHGGDPGTTMTFLSAGVPQLIIGGRPDESRNAAALEGCGAGRAIPGDTGPEQAAALVRTVMDDPSGATAMAAAVRAMPSPHDVVEAIEALAK